jgi:hypothetical protein
VEYCELARFMVARSVRTVAVAGMEDLLGTGIARGVGGESDGFLEVADWEGIRGWGGAVTGSAKCLP